MQGTNWRSDKQDAYGDYVTEYVAAKLLKEQWEAAVEIKSIPSKIPISPD